MKGEVTVFCWEMGRRYVIEAVVDEWAFTNNDWPKLEAELRRQLEESVENAIDTARVAWGLKNKRDDDRCACGSERRYCGKHFTPAERRREGDAEQLETALREIQSALHRARRNGTRPPITWTLKRIEVALEEGS